MTLLVVSFGGSHPANITATRRLSWEAYVQALLGEEPAQTEDKSSRGWSCPAKFSPPYRDSENFVSRYALTFDYDSISVADLAHIQTVYADIEHLAYTTWSHTEERPRWRFIFPLTRAVTYDEFQAVSRRVAGYAGIELAARESHVPAQMMYLPTVRPGTSLQSRRVEGVWLDPDMVLAEYENWADRAAWPRRRDGDGVQALGLGADPTEKPGVIGAFCRAFTVPEAIEHFGLPYTPTADPNRWTYTDGTRPEGVVIYDGGLKAHSHHDTDPARGQTNAFDLVRLHRFGRLDTPEDGDKPITDRASYREMVALALSQSEVTAELAGVEFDSLPADAPPEPPEESGQPPLARTLADVLATPSKPRWLIRDVLERGTIALLAGPRGTYKSFLALDWGMRVALQNEPVYVVSAEGGDFDRRAAAWLLEYHFGEDTPPLYVVERRMDLNSKDGVEKIRQDCVKLRIRPRLFILDTFSKLSGGLDENSNSDVKQFIGLLDNGLKRAFDATILLVAHTGHSNQGRARGASALEADTEAAHIVSRDSGSGMVLVSRERFKSSPELPPLVYQPKVIQLDRVDEDGMPITSVVLESSDQLGTVSGKDGRKKLGKYQKLLYQILEQRSRGGKLVPVEALFAASVEHMEPPDFGRDTRKQKLRTALDGMVIDGIVFKYGKAVSLSRTLEDDDGY